MKKSQITRYEDVRCSANHGYKPQHAKSVTEKKRRLKRQMFEMLKITMCVVFSICLAAAIMTAAANMIAYTEKQEEINESYAFIVEEREDDINDQYQNVNSEKVKSEIKNIRIPIAFSEETTNEEFVLYVDEKHHQRGYLEIPQKEDRVDENTTNVVEEIEEEPVEESVEIPEEYKPMKLMDYEISATQPYEHYVYILSEEDIKIIAKLVWMEARGECYEGKVAVAAVVLNRYFSDDQSFSRKSILHTVTQKNQFASIWDVTDWDLNNVPECLDAVKDACRGWDPTRAVFEEGALFFYAPDGVSGYQAQIRQNIKVMVIGNHNFHYDFEKVNG